MNLCIHTMQGGAVYISSGTGTFDSCTFSSNTAVSRTVFVAVVSLCLQLLAALIAFVLFPLIVEFAAD